MKGWNLKMSLPNHLCLVKSWLRFASQLQLAKLCFQTEIQLLINNLCKWVCHSLEILAVSSNQDICIFKMPPYLCYRNFTLHSDCLGIVTIPEIYKYVSSQVCYVSGWSREEQVARWPGKWLSEDLGTRHNARYLDHGNPISALSKQTNIFKRSN